MQSSNIVRQWYLLVLVPDHIDPFSDVVIMLPSLKYGDVNLGRSLDWFA